MPKFERHRRLTRPREFQAVKDGGIRARRGPIAVAVLPGTSRRLGMVVSKRIGSAPTRNRIKRLVREHFRQSPDDYPRGDCVVIPQAGISRLTNDEIRRALVQALAALVERSAEDGRDG